MLLPNPYVYFQVLYYALLKCIREVLPLSVLTISQDYSLHFTIMKGIAELILGILFICYCEQ